MSDGVFLRIKKWKKKCRVFFGLKPTQKKIGNEIQRGQGYEWPI